MDFVTLATVGAFIIEVLALVATVIWTINKISNTTDLLQQSIDHLSDAVKELSGENKATREVLNDHSTQLTRLETLVERSHTTRRRGE